MISSEFAGGVSQLYPHRIFGNVRQIDRHSHESGRETSISIKTDLILDDAAGACSQPWRTNHDRNRRLGCGLPRYCPHRRSHRGLIRRNLLPSRHPLSASSRDTARPTSANELARGRAASTILT